MSSEIKANKISPATGTSFTFGDSGDTFTIPSGVTLTNNGSSSGFDAGLASVQTFTSSGTWNRPTGITKVVMEILGAGGSGSAVGSTNYGNGAGGGYAKKLLDVSSISTSTITVGSGGAAKGAGQGAGDDGGNSSWADGTNTITGGGGQGHPGTSYTNATGGTATGGDVNIPGGPGWFTGLGGGESVYGYATDVNSVTGSGYGAGGGYGYTSYGSGAGSDGIVIVWEYN